MDEIISRSGRNKEPMNFATEILSDMKRQLIRCRVVLIISLVGNAIMAAVLIFM